MIELLWWHWGLIGFGLVLAELVIPSFFIFWFGLAAFLIMGLLSIFPDLALTNQLLIWTLTSILMVGGWFWIFKPSRYKTLIGRASASLIGEVGMVVETVDPFKKGKVRFQKPIVGSDLWDCSSDEHIETGSRVSVVSVDGQTVTIKKVGG